MCSLLLFGCFVGFSTIATTAVQPPSWQSDWYTLRSQNGSDSLLEIHHGLDEVPIKGKALVRPLRGPNAGLIFEGIGSAQADDDFNVSYCGVVFIFNEQHVRLGAPQAYNGYTKGRIFCAGQSGWTDTNGKSQAEQDAEVKVMLWLADAFPTPDVDTGWISVSCTDNTTVFQELANPTGQHLDLVHLHVKFADKTAETWYSEGVGTTNYDPELDPFGNQHVRQYGGAIYAHNENHLRLWIPVYQYGMDRVVCASDGWAFGTGTKALTAKEGEVRFYGWITVHQPLHTKEYTLNVDLDNINTLLDEVSLGQVTWNPETDFITLQVTPDGGDNLGYTFYGTGAMPREQWNTLPFGGVQFGYNADVVRLFYPVGTVGCLVRIGPTWGLGMHQGCSRSGTVRVTIWANASKCKSASVG